VPDIAPGHQCLILDACCLINLYASGRLLEILPSLGQVIVIAEYVQSEEALRIRGNASDESTVVYEPIDLRPAIESGLLSVVSLETEVEEQRAVDYIGALLDTGEAITGAIAISRLWAIATDDRKATSFFARVAPQLQLVTTPEMIKHWCDSSAPAPDDVRRAIRDIRVRARYVPRRQHPLRAWWDRYA